MSHLTFKDSYTTSPSDVKPNDAFAWKIVAVAGHNNDYAVYSGPADWTDERVAESGDKLFAFQAEKLFYVMSERTYRD